MQNYYMKLKTKILLTLVAFLMSTVVVSNRVEAKLFNFLNNFKNAAAKNSDISSAQSEMSVEGEIYNKVTESVYEKGTEYEYWVFEPDEADLEKKFPLIVFNHGWNGKNPFFYQGWINHIVKRGNIVIFPRLQKKAWNLTSTYTPNAITSIKMALEMLNNNKKHHKPNLEKVATAGHSVGGIISANLAASAASSGLPKFRAVMCVEPGATWLNTKMDDLSKIPSGTLLLTVAGGKDTLALDIDAKKIFNEAINIPIEEKNFISIPSADHLAPCGTQNSDVDAYGFWQLFDDLCDDAFGKNSETESENGETEKSMSKLKASEPTNATSRKKFFGSRDKRADN